MRVVERVCNGVLELVVKIIPVQIDPTVITRRVICIPTLHVNLYEKLNQNTI